MACYIRYSVFCCVQSLCPIIFCYVFCLQLDLVLVHMKVALQYVIASDCSETHCAQLEINIANLLLYILLSTFHYIRTKVFIFILVRGYLMWIYELFLLLNWPEICWSVSPDFRVWISLVCFIKWVKVTQRIIVNIGISPLFIHRVNLSGKIFSVIMWSY